MPWPDEKSMSIPRCFVRFCSLLAWLLSNWLRSEIGEVMAFPAFRYASKFVEPIIEPYVWLRSACAEKCLLVPGRHPFHCEQFPPRVRVDLGSGIFMIVGANGTLKPVNSMSEIHGETPLLLVALAGFPILHVGRSRPLVWRLSCEGASRHIGWPFVLGQ